MNIRAATSADVPMVLPMVASICALHESWDPAKYSFLPNPAQRYERWLVERTKNKQDVFLVADPENHDAQNANRLAGFLVATVETEVPIYCLKQYGFIHDLWVEPDYRGQGVGQQLVKTALAQFAQQGISQVRLDTVAVNESARRLFQTCGFRISTIEMLVELEK